jgi:hypothetical protein
MKIKFNKDRALNFVIAGYVAFIIFSFFRGCYQSGPSEKFGGPSYVYTDTRLKPFDPPIPDSLEQSKTLYNKIKDSLTLIRDFKNADFPGASSTSGLLYLGTSGTVYCDTCSIQLFFNGKHNESQIRYGIKLLGWEVKEAKSGEFFSTDSVVFHIEHNQAYLRKCAIVSPAIKNKDGSLFHKIGMVDEPVKFRYDRRDQCLIIPVNKTVKNTMDVIFLGVGIGLASFFLALTGTFIVFIIDLSNGLAFTDKNILTLQRIAITLLVYPVATFLFNLLIRLIFNSYFTSDVVLKNDVWDGSWKIIALGIVFLMLWKAFKQGKRLKDEQDLTV